MLVGDHQRLGELETNELYNNAIYTVMEIILSVFLAKERDKTLRRNFGAM